MFKDIVGKYSRINLFSENANILCVTTDNKLMARLKERFHFAQKLSSDV